MNKKLLEILVCPQSKEALAYDEAKQELISVGAKSVSYTHLRAHET